MSLVELFKTRFVFVVCMSARDGLKKHSLLVDLEERSTGSSTPITFIHKIGVHAYKKNAHQKYKNK